MQHVSLQYHIVHDDDCIVMFHKSVPIQPKKNSIFIKLVVMNLSTIYLFTSHLQRLLLPSYNVKLLSHQIFSFYFSRGIVSFYFLNISFRWRNRQNLFTPYHITGRHRVILTSKYIFLRGRYAYHFFTLTRGSGTSDP